MLFNTPQFALFFALVAAGWLALERWHRVRLALLLVASLWFYAQWDARFLALLCGVTVMDWALALWLARTEEADARRRLVALAAVANLSVLGVFKYAGFALDTVRPLAVTLGARWPQAPGWALPVGISFFTFQGLGYVVDVYRREMAPVKSLPRFALVKAFFPQLVAGPIVRPSVLVPQFDRPGVPAGEKLGRAVGLVCRGLVKKAAADFLAAALVDKVFDVPSMYTSPEVLAAVYGYALQIYGDFSGYTDVAIGLAALLGFELPANFDHPYAATSLRDFWRRWHISLSSWLRDYLYVPLGGSRGGFWKTQRNLFLTMLLGGLWHGASWNFVLWGACHGAWLVGERLHERWGRLRVPGPLGWFVTFHVVCTLWVFFRAESFSGALAVLRQLASGGWGLANVTWKLALLLSAGFVLHLWPAHWRERLYGAFERAPVLVHATAVLAALYAARALGGPGAQPFIYFQF